MDHIQDPIDILERELRRLRHAQDENSWVDDTNRQDIQSLKAKVEVLTILVERLVKHTKLPAPPLQPKTIPIVKAAGHTDDLQVVVHFDINLWLEYGATDEDIIKLAKSGCKNDLIDYYSQGNIYTEELRPLYEHLSYNDVGIQVNVNTKVLEEWIKVNRPSIYASCETTSQYWDCECEDNYIHPNTEDKCDRCGAVREEQPNSRKIEVAAYLKSQNHATERL